MKTYTLSEIMEQAQRQETNFEVKYSPNYGHFVSRVTWESVYPQACNDTEEFNLRGISFISNYMTPKLPVDLDEISRNNPDVVSVFFTCTDPDMMEKPDAVIEMHRCVFRDNMTPTLAELGLDDPKFAFVILAIVIETKQSMIFNTKNFLRQRNIHQLPTTIQ